MSSLNEMSYNISCDHIKQLNNKYNKDNDRLFKEKFICFNNDDINNIRYLNNIYVSRKSCIYKSTEPDEYKWTNYFLNNNEDIKKCIYNSINDIRMNNAYNNNNTTTIFNENTRQKSLTKY
jgi:hypothetical protein